MKRSHNIDNEGFKRILLYTTPNGDVKIEIYLQNETVWLTQQKLAELFGVDRSVVTKHLKNIFQSNELDEDSVCAIIAHTAADGKKYSTRFYNLDAIISVGYRVNSSRATQFRMWANNVLKEYIIKGFAMNDMVLKEGKAYYGKDYFRELLERIRSIRTSERRIYQQITDIFAECSIDYNPQSEITRSFYAMVQNKFHFAITRQTAAEIIYEKADKSKPFMGLSTWKNAPQGRILASDVTIAKNYLAETEIKKLERTISGFFDYIENLIENENQLTMNDLAETVDSFLKFNKFPVLKGKGKITKKEADLKALNEYSDYNKFQPLESDFDKEIKKYYKQ